MAVLHLLANPDAGPSCLALVAVEDRLLLIGDGVFALPTVASATLRRGVLRDDASERGVAIPDDIEALSYDDFVSWVVACERSITWT